MRFPVNTAASTGLVLVLAAACGTTQSTVAPSRTPSTTAAAPVPASIATPTQVPEGGMATPSPTTPAERPSGEPTLRVQFFDEDGEQVTVDVHDGSGMLVGARQGSPAPGAYFENATHDVSVANGPSNERLLRVEWFSPAGCTERPYALVIGQDPRDITVQASYPVGQDSIGGNCGVTLELSEPVPAAEVRAVLENTPPR